jgi:hypothetical protein
MVEGPEPGRRADTLSDTDRLPSAVGPGKRRWTWGLGGIVAASAVWAAVLHGTGYGRTTAPDLHGIRLDDTPCTSANLEPLSDTVPAEGFGAGTPEIRQGPALDHVACTMTSWHSTGDGWSTSYAFALTVDLHKKTDPRAEFEDTYDPRVSSPRPEEIDGTLMLPTIGAVTSTCPGLGDKAYATSGTTYQSLSVLYGGVVLSLSVEATNVWRGPGKEPDDADTSSAHPALVDVSALRPVLPPTMRHLMSALSL